MDLVRSKAPNLLCSLLPCKPDLDESQKEEAILPIVVLFHLSFSAFLKAPFSSSCGTWFRLPVHRPLSDANHVAQIQFTPPRLTRVLPRGRPRGRRRQLGVQLGRPGGQAMPPPRSHEAPRDRGRRRCLHFVWNSFRGAAKLKGRHHAGACV